MKTLWLFLVLLLSSCAEATGAADAGSATIAQEVNNPDTVCGEPTMCQSYTCYIPSPGRAPICNRIQDPSAICREACGTWNATCPDGPTYIDCYSQCNGNDQMINDLCLVGCMTQHRSCQFGTTQ